jgi:hypothetical protein
MLSLACAGTGLDGVLALRNSSSSKQQQTMLDFGTLQCEQHAAM